MQCSQMLHATQYHTTNFLWPWFLLLDFFVLITLKNHDLKTWYQNTNQFLRWRLASSNLDLNQCAIASDAMQSDAPCNSISYYNFLWLWFLLLDFFVLVNLKSHHLNLISKYKSISEMMASILKPRLKSMCKIIWCNAIRCFHATQYHTTNYQFLRWKIVPSKICSIDVQDARASDTMQSDASAKNWYHATYRFSELKDITIFKPGVSMSKEHLVLQCNRMILWKSISYYKSISDMKAKCPQIWSTNVQRALDIAMQTDVSVKIHFILQPNNANHNSRKKNYTCRTPEIETWEIQSLCILNCGPDNFIKSSWILLCYLSTIHGD
jgi:hypothetical protein